tara:strand:- start:1 stop:222 length:222 start_codon:yes stop_codon:yes gene_type:complete
MEKISEDFRGYNPITEAYGKGRLGVTLADNENNTSRLTRFRKRTGAKATGKQIGGSFVIVFWDNVKEQLEKEK